MEYAKKKCKFCILFPKLIEAGLGPVYTPGLKPEYAVETITAIWERTLLKSAI